MIERRGEPVDIRPRPLPRGAHLLGGRVARREDRRHGRRLTGHRRTCCAEIDQGRMTLIVEHDVGRLDVAMQEARIVNLFETIEQRPQDPADNVWLQSAPSTQPPIQCFAAQKLHDDVGRAVLLQEVEDPHDARRTMERCQRPAFGDEAVATLGEIVEDPGRARRHGRSVPAHCERCRQELLQGDFATELGVEGPVGDAEAALAQDGQHLVPSDLRARRQGHEIDVRRVVLVGPDFDHAPNVPPMTGRLCCRPHARKEKVAGDIGGHRPPAIHVTKRQAFRRRSPPDGRAMDYFALGFLVRHD